MNIFKTIIANCAVLAALSALYASDLKAQSNCQPPDTLGVSGPEICVVVTETAGPASEACRGPSPLVIPSPACPNAVIGDYEVSLTLTYGGITGAVAGTGSMSLATEGTATRIALANGRGNGLTVTAHAGWGVVLDDPDVDLQLVGSSTSTSYTQLGGGALAPAVPNGIPAQDVKMVGVSQALSLPTYGPGSFNDQILDQPLNFAAFADKTVIGVQSIVGFHLNEIGDETDIPSFVGLSAGMGAPSPSVVPGPHFQCYDVQPLPMRPRESWVALKDQFREARVILGGIVRICAPVDKNNEGIEDPEIHLVCYQVIDQPPVNIPVKITNQLEKSRQVVRTPRELCVPSFKERLDK